MGAITIAAKNIGTNERSRQIGEDLACELIASDSIGWECIYMQRGESLTTVQIKISIKQSHKHLGTQCPDSRHRE